MAEDTKPKVDQGEYIKSTAQLDLERRMENGNLPEHLLLSNETNDALNPQKVNAPWASEDHDTSAYRGVSPEYMQYSDDTSKPLAADEGPEAAAQKRLESGVAGVRKTIPVDNEPASVVGVTDTETINTATSGAGYSASLVDAPKDHFGPVTVQPAPVEAPSTVKTPTRKSSTS